MGISNHFAMTFQSLSFIIGLYVVAFIKSWKLTLITSVAMPIIMIVYGVTVPPFLKIRKITEELHEEASALSFEMFASIRVVVAFGAEAKLARRHEEILDRALRNGKREAKWASFMMAPAMAATYAMFALAFWFSVRQYQRGEIVEVGNIVVVLFSVMMAVMNIGRLAAPIMAITKAAAAATELFATIDATIPDISGFKDPDVSADLDISFDNVAFSYPSRPQIPILENFSARFEAGKVTAIVGPSGSGKSTLVSLIQRWYDLTGTVAREPTEKPEGAFDEKSPEEEKKKDKKKDKKKAKKNDKKPGKHEEDEEVDLGPNTCTGSVRIGNVDLRDVDRKWWRSNCGLVQQEPFLFNDTLFNNVAYGLCGTKWQDAPREEQMELVKAACKEAYAEEFIDRLPQGYETSVGESGIKLSGGQRQRISIARGICPNALVLGPFLTTNSNY
jgi:ATP-binding cassette subfamily B (MDR/TAP) protein 1